MTENNKNQELQHNILDYSDSSLEHMSWKATAGAFSLEYDDKDMETMTGSYSEILGKSLLGNDPQDIAAATSENDNLHAPTEGIDPDQMYLSKERISYFIKRNHDSSAGLQARPWSLEVGTPGSVSTPDTSVGGQSAGRGEIVNFVAEDFEAKLKLASSVSGGSSQGESQSSTPSLLRSVLDPHTAPIDPTVINDLEIYARSLATGIDTLIENLTGTLHSISALTVECIETYRDAVCKTCDAVDSNIKCMYQLMAKTEELSKSMKPAYKIQDQIKEVKRLLDIYESILLPGFS